MILASIGVWGLLGCSIKPLLDIFAQKDVFDTCHNSIIITTAEL
jgi:hypothetical protein